MKANDLRIGNWVSFLGKEKQVLGLSKRNYEMGTETSGYYIETKESIPVNFIHITPIPLTEEWLFRFGFSRLDKYTFVKNGFFIHKRKSGFIFNVGRKKVPLPFVHTLQNLFYSLTGKELKEEKKEQPATQ